MTTIYTLAAEFQALDDLIDDDVTNDDHDVVQAWLEELSGALDAKMAGCIAYVREQEALALAAKNEAERLSALRKTRENRVKRIKAALLWLFDAQGLTKIETPIGTVAMRANGGQQALEIDPVPVDDLPLWATKLVADTDAIREAAEKKAARLDGDDGKEFARLLPRGKNIQIK